MKRQKTALAEFAAPDNETVVGEIIASQSQRFGDAQARRSQQTEQVMVGMQADRALRRQIECRPHDRPNLIGL
jgi:hypothetical protein